MSDLLATQLQETGKCFAEGQTLDALAIAAAALGIRAQTLVIRRGMMVRMNPSVTNDRSEDSSL